MGEKMSWLMPPKKLRSPTKKTFLFFGDPGALFRFSRGEVIDPVQRRVVQQFLKSNPGRGVSVTVKITKPVAKAKMQVPA
jgi:hypothetical protein